MTLVHALGRPVGNIEWHTVCYKKSCRTVYYTIFSLNSELLHSPSGAQFIEVQHPVPTGVGLSVRAINLAAVNRWKEFAASRKNGPVHCRVEFFRAKFTNLA